MIRNTGWLLAAQVAAAPLAITLSAILARRLGAADFGQLYLSGTVCGLAFLVVDFGQATVLPGLVARDRGFAAELLGGALLWRLAAGVLAIALLAAGAALADAAPSLSTALRLSSLACALGALSRVGLDAIRGFERGDAVALAVVGQQVLTVGLTVPVLLLGGGLSGALQAQVAAAALGGVGAVVLARRVGVPRPILRLRPLGRLRREGAPFLLLGLAVAAQPNVDALLLSRFSPPEVIGWHGASLKLIGALALPVSALIASLYPTLSRLHQSDRAGYHRTSRLALRTAVLLSLPLALGCALFPEVGISIFGRQGYAPALDNLRVLSLHVLLLYASMTLGCCLSAAGRQRAWTLCQVGCVGLAASLDLWLIPLLQARTGNGGLGVAFSLVLCEVAMLAAALWLLPREILDRSLFRALGRIALAGAAMALVAWLLVARGPWVAVPAAAAVYLGALQGGGELDWAGLARLATSWWRPAEAR